MSVDQLVDRFVDIAIAQDVAMLHDRTAEYNRLYRKMKEIDDTLRLRGSEARLALTRLYTHPNLQVRLAAAIRTLALRPIAAREVLQALSDSGELPQALDAGMTLVNLDRGIFKPT
jgi:hypothetical protein